MLIEILSTFALVICTVYAFLKYKLSYWQRNGVPTDEPQLPFGHLAGVGKTKHTLHLLNDFYFKYKNKSPICGLYFAIEPVALVTDVNLLKTILVKDFHNFEDHGIYFNEKDDPLTGHLFALEGEKWRKLRQILSPTFTSGKMKYMYPTMLKTCQRFQTRLGEITEKGNDIEIKDWVARFTTDVIGTCAFGLDCNCLYDPNAIFREMGRKVFEERRHSTIVVLLLSSFREIGRALHMKVNLDEVSEFFTKVVNDTLKYRMSSDKKYNDFMDLMVELKKNGATSKGLDALTDEEIQAQAFVFYLAGFETSSTLMTFCLYELALNQDIQEKARKYVNDTIAKHNGELSYECMMDMKYIDQILSETLRKHPPVTSLLRMCKNDYKVPDTNIVIPKNTKVMIPSYAIHHDHSVYPNPEKFDPDRFSDEEEKKRSPYVFLPFGEGPRICIGMRFGMMQARIGITLLLQKFKFDLIPGTKVPIEIDNNLPILAPKGGMPLRITPV